MRLTPIRARVRGGSLYTRFGSGQIRRITTGHDDRDPSWSPRARRLAFARDGAIVTTDADGRHLRRLTTSDRWSHPVWSPDGRWLALVGADGDPRVMRADGSARLILSSANGFTISLDWQPAARAPGARARPIGRAAC